MYKRQAEPPLPPRRDEDDDDDDDDDEDKPWTRAGIVKLVIGAVIGFLVFVVLGEWIESTTGEESAAGFFYHVVGGVIITGTFGYVFRVIKEYRQNRRR